jgi:hypothetical protein
MHVLVTDRSALALALAHIVTPGPLVTLGGGCFNAVREDAGRWNGEGCLLVKI